MNLVENCCNLSRIDQKIRLRFLMNVLKNLNEEKKKYIFMKCCEKPVEQIYIDMYDKIFTNFLTFTKILYFDIRNLNVNISNLYVYIPIHYHLWCYTKRSINKHIYSCDCKDKKSWFNLLYDFQIFQIIFGKTVN